MAHKTATSPSALHADAVAVFAALREPHWGVKPMTCYTQTLGHHTYTFDSLKTLMAKASSQKSGDELAGIAATSAEERIAARLLLADVPLTTFLDQPLIPYETDEVTRLILDTYDQIAFTPIRSFTVGDLRNWLLSYQIVSRTSMPRG